MDESANPFRFPSEKELFCLRAIEKQEKQLNKHKMQHLKIHDKMTKTSEIGRISRYRADGDSAIDPSIREYKSSQARPSKGLIAAATTALSFEHVREKERMVDFIAKKKEMFLVQMSLDTKREEIRKLEEKAQLKEAALRKSELMLEDDAVRFDSFLKENDKKAHEAIKRAEKETKAKGEKALEIKKLTQQIQTVQSEMAKLSEQLQDSLRYKAFLDELTPSDYGIRQNQQHILSQASVIATDHSEKSIGLSTITETERQENSQAKDDKASSPTVDELAGREDFPMYFHHPQQLLDIFTALEESNLFLIQNSQETEQALEELRQTFCETKENMEKKSNALNHKVDELRDQIEQEKHKMEQLSNRSHGGPNENSQEQLLQDLHDRVYDVYKRCGFEAEANSSTLYMLSDLEARLEDLLSAIEQMPEEYVVRAEKEKEKDRRERVRLERISQQKQQYEERMKKSMDRSMQAPKKRNGRQVMWRSQPQRQHKQIEDIHSTEKGDEADLHHFIW